MEKIELGTIVRLLDNRYINYLVDSYDFGMNGETVYKLKSLVYYSPDRTALRGDFELYLTLADTLKMQSDGLKEWKGKLNAQVYTDLESVMLASNEGKTNPCDINKGQSLSSFVTNWKPNKPLNEIYF